MRLTTCLAGAFAVAASGILSAQTPRPAERVRDELYAKLLGGDRAMLGISIGSGGVRDTLGLLVASVTPGGPAAKAGIEEGNRIAAVNGVSLRLDRLDAEDPAMSGVLQRRLTRELSKVKAGDEVDVRVWADGSYKNVKVKTVAADDLSGVKVTRSSLFNRAALGMSLSATGSPRDTLGLFVMSVTTDGPAEKAGIMEGDRIAALNNVDLRVAREDAGDDWAGSARMNRFRREIEKLKPDDEVELRVWSSGRSRSVKVKVVRASDLPRVRGSSFIIGGDEFRLFPGGVKVMPAIPPMAPTAPRAPRVFRFDGDLRDGFRVEMDPDFGFEVRARALEAAREARRRAEELRYELQDRMHDLRLRLEDMRDDTERLRVRGEIRASTRGA